jgi:sugar lactone lactonase YvrE
LLLTQQRSQPRTYKKSQFCRSTGDRCRCLNKIRPHFREFSLLVGSAFHFVAELVNGEPKPFPNDEWNKPGPAASHFVCVQSVVVDDQDNLWVLDPAAPKMQEIVKGGPKLVKIDLRANQVAQTIPFGEDIAPAKSYLNDVRIDTRSETAFITDSGKGAIIVVNLKDGNARRLLDGHASTQPEKGFKLVVDGRELIDQQKNAPPQIASDGIALDAKNGYLYYHALTAHTLYRIKTTFLTDEQLSEKDLESKVENVGQTPAPDGMLEAPDGSIYLTDLEHNAVVHWNPETKSVEQVIADKRLMWPDTLSWGPNNELYVTTSQIENMPRFNNGQIDANRSVQALEDDRSRPVIGLTIAFAG